MISHRQVLARALRYALASTLLCAVSGGVSSAALDSLTSADLNARAMVMDFTTDGGNYNDQLIRSPAVESLKNALRNCLGTYHDADSGDFTLLALVSKDGRPFNIRVVPQNQLSTCLNHRFEQAILPPWTANEQPFPVAITFDPKRVEARLPFRHQGPPSPPSPPSSPQAGPRTIPVLQRSPSIQYPLQSLVTGGRATATVMALVGASGATEKARIDTSAGAPELDATALDFIENATFTPATIQGVAKPMFVRVPVSFSGTLADDQKGLVSQYVEQLNAQIQSHWHARRGLSGQCVLKISQQADGTVTHAQAMTPCGFGSLDQDVLVKAVMEASPLPVEGYEKFFRQELFFNVVAPR